MRSMKAFQPPRTLSNEHRLSGGSAFYANNRNSWGVAPGFLRSQTLYLKKQIFTGVKRRREGKECGREGGRVEERTSNPHQTLGTEEQY